MNQHMKPAEAHFEPANAPTVQPIGRSRLLKAVPWLWLGLSALWAAVIVVTGHLAWPLALWIATTVGPLTALDRRRGRRQRAATG